MVRFLVPLFGRNLIHVLFLPEDKKWDFLGEISLIFHPRKSGSEQRKYLVMDNTEDERLDSHFLFSLIFIHFKKGHGGRNLILVLILPEDKNGKKVKVSMS